ncbi:MAG TPA: hypothetical protein VK831_04935 [Candidatus Deferrimicrobiaceae bacterium]|nr:hypothetical protein [Candidatus Deferrimicrobiaceae bacterium]
MMRHGELQPIDQLVALACTATTFELLDVQALRPHYALTLELGPAAGRRGTAAVVVLD